MKRGRQILTENDSHKAGRTIVPRGVMVHSTGANNPELRRYVQPDDGRLGANRHGNHWNRPGVQKCVHAFIGKTADGTVAVYQTLPWTCRGWHCGGKANNTHISFEICEDRLEDGEYFKQVYQAAVGLTAICAGSISWTRWPTAWSSTTTRDTCGGSRRATRTCPTGSHGTGRAWTTSGRRWPGG